MISKKKPLVSLPLTACIICVVMFPLLIKTVLGDSYEFYPSFAYPAGAFQENVEDGMVEVRTTNYEVSENGKDFVPVNPRVLFWPIYIQYVAPLRTIGIGLEENSQDVLFTNTSGHVTGFVDMVGLNKKRVIDSQDVEQAKKWYKENLDRAGFPSDYLRVSTHALTLSFPGGDTLEFNHTIEKSINLNPENAD